MAKKFALYTPAEIEIAEIQLESLKDISRERLLTPDETKQYDLLVKNLMLIRGNPTVITGTANTLEDLSDAELIAIANAAGKVEIHDSPEIKEVSDGSEHDS